MRLFMIQHDCGHGALFRRRTTNDWVGRTIGVVTLTPYGFWLRTHALHHANAGNLDHRGFGDIITITSDEYLALSPLCRLAYRLYRSPYIMFGPIPTYLFVLHYRIPMGLMRSGLQPWLSTMGTNATIAGVVALMVWFIGVGPFLLVHGLVVAISASIAVWFFYVQHQFEDTLWTRHGDWSFHEAALNGSSHYKLPRALAGSRAISGYIMCTIWPVASPSIVSHRFCAIIHNSRASVGSRSFRACDARPSPCGTRSRDGLYRFWNCACAVRRRFPRPRCLFLTIGGASYGSVRAVQVNRAK